MRTDERRLKISDWVSCPNKHDGQKILLSSYHSHPLVLSFNRISWFGSLASFSQPCVPDARGEDTVTQLLQTNTAIKPPVSPQQRGEGSGGEGGREVGENEGEEEGDGGGAVEGGKEGGRRLKGEGEEEWA